MLSDLTGPQCDKFICAQMFKATNKNGSSYANIF